MKRRNKVKWIVIIILIFSIILSFIVFDIKCQRESVRSKVECEYVSVTQGRHIFFVKFRELDSGDVFEIPVKEMSLSNNNIIPFYRYDWGRFHWYVYYMDAVEYGEDNSRSIFYNLRCANKIFYG